MIKTYLTKRLYDERLAVVGLVYGLFRTDLIELFKLVKGFSGTPWNGFFDRSEITATDH